MKTPLPGVVWCNCPHMAGIDGLKVEDLTRAEIVGRQHIHALVDFVRGKLPGFEHCFVVDVAPQTGVRQTRLLDGEYVMTRKTWCSACASTTASRAAATTTRSAPCCPGGSTTCWWPAGIIRRPRRRRRYPARSPCMAMGEAAGTAAALALNAGVTARDIDVRALQKTLRAGAPIPATRPA